MVTRIKFNNSEEKEMLCVLLETIGWTRIDLITPYEQLYVVLFDDDTFDIGGLEFEKTYSIDYLLSHIEKNNGKINLLLWRFI